MFQSDDNRLSLFLILLCPISLSLMGYAVKMSGAFSVAIVLLARFGISAIIYSAVLVGKGFAFRELRPAKHVLRTILGFSSVACLFGSISLIPLSTALCLSYTVPIFSYIISVATGQIKPDYRFIFVLGAVGAIALIVQPSANVDLVGILLGLASAFLGTLALFEIKRITKTEGSEAILFMYFLYSTVALLLFVYIVGGKSQISIITSNGMQALIAVGIFGFLYQFSLVGTLKSISVATVSLALLFAVALGYGIDIMLLDADVTIWALMGTALLTFCIAAYSRTA